MKPATRALMLMTAIAAACPPAIARAAPPSAGRGQQLAKAYCAACHAIAGEPASPNAAAPPFRDLERNNPGSNLDEVFARGFLVSHSAMPQFGARPEDMQDLLAYLKGVQAGAPSPAPSASRPPGS